MDEFVTRYEHNEFAKRVEAEETRQNHRLSKLEDAVQNLNRLTVAVERMAMSMDHMAEKQEDMSTRLGELEREPADHWRQMKSGIIGAIATAVGAAIIAVLFHYM